MQSFLTAFCSEITITNTNITDNTITTNTNNDEDDDCLFCFGYNTKIVMNDNIFDNNNGIMIYSSYSSSSALLKNNMLDLSMNGNIFNTHSNTGIVLQSNTRYPSTIDIVNLNVASSMFGSNAFIVLYPNINSNIKITDSIFDDNNGALITSKVIFIASLSFQNHFHSFINNNRLIVTY